MLRLNPFRCKRIRPVSAEFPHRAGTSRLPTPTCVPCLGEGAVKWTCRAERQRLDRHVPNDPAGQSARPRGYPGVRDEWGGAGRATGPGPVRGHGAGLRHCRLRWHHTGSPDRRCPTRVGGKLAQPRPGHGGRAVRLRLFSAVRPLAAPGAALRCCHSRKSKPVTSLDFFLVCPHVCPVYVCSCRCSLGGLQCYHPSSLLCSPSSPLSSDHRPHYTSKISRYGISSPCTNRRSTARDSTRLIGCSGPGSPSCGQAGNVPWPSSSPAR